MKRLKRSRLAKSAQAPSSLVSSVSDVVLSKSMVFSDSTTEDQLTSPLLSEDIEAQSNPRKKFTEVNFSTQVSEDPPSTSIDGTHATTDKSDKDRKSFKSPVSPPYKRRSAMVRRGARAAIKAMSRDELKRASMVNIPDESDFLDASGGHSVSTDPMTNTGVQEDLDANVEKVDEETPITFMAMVKTAAVVTLTIGGVASYVLAFLSVYVVAASTLTIVSVGVAGGVLVMVTPLVWWNELALIRLPGLRLSINQLRQEAMFLETEVNVLHVEVSMLKEESERMLEGEEKLARIVAKEAESVRNFVGLMKENEATLKHMKENLRQVVLQDAIRCILRSDSNRDGKLDQNEAKILEFNLQVSLGAYGIVFDTEKFNRAIGLSPSLINVMAIVKRLIPDENNRISSFYNDDSDDNGSDHDDNDNESEDDTYDMFYIEVNRESEKLCAETLFMCKNYVRQTGNQPKYLSLAPCPFRDNIRRLRCTLGIGDCPINASTTYEA